MMHIFLNFKYSQKNIKILPEKKEHDQNIYKKNMVALSRMQAKT